MTSKTPIVDDEKSLDGLDAEEASLVRHAGVTLKEIERARRVRQKLRSPRSLGEILVELGQLSAEKHEGAIRARRSTMTIAELLHEDGHLSDGGLGIYRQARAEDPEATDRSLLVEAELITEEEFLRALCSKSGLQYVEPEVGLVDPKLLGRTSFRYLLRHRALPLHVLDGRLSVILADPTDVELIGELERMFGMRVAPSCCTTEKITEALRTLERLRGVEGGSLSLQYREIEDVPAGDETGEEAVQIVDYLLARGIQLGASDLHIEPTQSKIRVRVRIDGVLQQLTNLPIEFAPRVVSRVKILSGADIAEKRLHQDGRIFVKFDAREVDIRVSSYASVYGETLTLRILDRNKGIVPLDHIGFAAPVYAALDELVLKSSSGLVLLVGPTGSGKTTTLYSFIAHANDPTEKVITCEDPVEYVIDGVIQCSVNQKTGPTFADSLRAIVRQDPDTIVVGEVRDRTTAELALESALTGHKVYSTFHTEDAVGAFLRLLDMGLEPFLVSSTVAAVVAQRLVRGLCAKCRKPVDPERSVLRFLGLERSELKPFEILGGPGCPLCRGSGFSGRLAIHEVLLPDDEFRDAVLRRAPAKTLREQARRLPQFLTLQEDGVLKAIAGATTLGEIVANAPRDAAARPLSTLVAGLKAGRFA